MPTNPQSQSNSSEGTLHMSLELSAKCWKLGFADQLGRKARVRSVEAGSLVSLKLEITSARKVFGLDPDAPVVSCYEAGRDGFWIHRCLVSLGIESHIVDPASIQVSRKKRRAKTDRIDAEQIVNALMRLRAGDRFACRMIRVPEEDIEDARQINREMRVLKTERAAHVNRIKGLLCTQGITQTVIDGSFPRRLLKMKTATGKLLSENLQLRLQREFDRLAVVTSQIRSLQMSQAKFIREAAKEINKSRAAVTAARLAQLLGIGPVSAWTLSTEVFSWRDIQNRRQLGALAGLTPTPHTSGDDEKEQGISKSGRGELRVLLIEVAWLWLMHQPQSDLSKWYVKRFNDGTKRNRKIGIVALARKLLVALGKYVRHGEIPAGAKLSNTFTASYLPLLKIPGTELDCLAA